jgi:hypothetical protein
VGEEREVEENGGEEREVEENGGEEREGKETDGCPLTLPPLPRRGVTTCEDRQCKGNYQEP